MVLPGQYLERPTLIVRRPASEGSSGLTLEGLYHRGQRAPGVVVCAPHPRMGGSMDSAVVAELAWAFTRQGHATLRFNYEGVGASEGTLQAPLPEVTGLSVSSLVSESGDALAATQHLQACLDGGKVALAGYSFGAAVAVSVALQQAEPTPLVLVAPPTHLFDFSVIERVRGAVFVAAGDLDPFVDQSMLQELARKCPHLHLERLKGADHSFTRGLTELGSRAARWLATVAQLGG